MTVLPWRDVWFPVIVQYMLYTSDSLVSHKVKTHCPSLHWSSCWDPHHGRNNLLGELILISSTIESKWRVKHHFKLIWPKTQCSSVFQVETRGENKGYLFHDILEFCSEWIKYLSIYLLYLFVYVLYSVSLSVYLSVFSYAALNPYTREIWAHCKDDIDWWLLHYSHSH